MGSLDMKQAFGRLGYAVILFCSLAFVPAAEAKGGGGSRSRGGSTGGSRNNQYYNDQGDSGGVVGVLIAVAIIVSGLFFIVFLLWAGASCFFRVFDRRFDKAIETAKKKFSRTPPLTTLIVAVLACLLLRTPLLEQPTPIRRTTGACRIFRPPSYWRSAPSMVPPSVVLSLDVEQTTMGLLQSFKVSCHLPVSVTGWKRCLAVPKHGRS